MAHAWLLCSYRLPRDPSRLRLAIWRRARRLGAVLLQDAVWALPADHRTREDFEWLAEEVEERGGSALLWSAESLSPEQDRAMIAQFREAAGARYTTIEGAARQLARVATRRRLNQAAREQVLQRLRLLERELRLERRRDYFRSEQREPAERAIADVMALLRTPAGTATPGRGSRAVGD